MLIVFTLIFGALAPKIGRRNLALISITSIFILTYPLFMILKEGSLIGVILVQIVFALSLSCIEGIYVEMMASQFKDAFRARGLGLSFTLPTAIFGGIAPTVCSYLIYKTDSDISAIGFLMVMCLFALPAAMTLKQSEKKLSSLCIKKHSAQQSFNQ
jgi:MHS family proline/betaine transporter-like MFS transporter